MSRSRKKRVGARKKNKRGSKKSLTKVKAIFVVFSFIFLLFVGLFYLHHIRDDIKGVVLQKELGSKTEILDEEITKKLFELGIDRNNILETKVERKSSGNISWDYKEISFKIGNPELKKKIVSEIKNLASDAGVKVEVVTSTEGFEIFFDVERYRTHKLTFVFPLLKKKNVVLSSKNKSSSRVKVASRDKKGSDVREIPAKPFKKPKVAIIVDDLGRDKDSIEALVEISKGFTVAVLPYLPYSVYTAKVAKKNGMEVLLHLPMEPKLSSGYSADDAGVGVLMVGQPKEKILDYLEKNIKSVPYIVGVNNHMGSKFTENHELMELVLKKLKERGLFFVDSKTSSVSRGPEIAKQIGLKFTTRDIFLDMKDLDREYVLTQLDKLVEISKNKGFAVGICHPYPQTIEALKQAVPEISKHVEIVPVSKILNHTIY